LKKIKRERSLKPATPIVSWTAKFCGFDLAAIERARLATYLPHIALAPPTTDGPQIPAALPPEALSVILSEAEVQSLVTQAAQDEFKKYINWKTDEEVASEGADIIVHYRDQGRLENKINSTLVKRMRKMLGTRGPTDAEIAKLQATFINELNNHLDAAQLNAPLEVENGLTSIATSNAPKAANDAL
jgi:hypothetical protein